MVGNIHIEEMKDKLWLGVKQATQKAIKELKKNNFCWLCKSNELHEIKLAHMPHEDVIKLSDIEIWNVKNILGN